MSHVASGKNMLQLLDMLEDHIAEGKRVFMSNKIIVEETEFLAVTDQLRECIPHEIRDAQDVLLKRQAIIADAQAEAARIIQKAKERADYLVSDAGITAEARYRGENTIRDARETAARTMAQVDAFAKNRLDTIEQSLRKGLDEITSAKQSVVGSRG